MLVPQRNGWSDFTSVLYQFSCQSIRPTTRIRLWFPPQFSKTKQELQMSISIRWRLVIENKTFVVSVAVKKKGNESFHSQISILYASSSRVKSLCLIKSNCGTGKKKAFSSSLYSVWCYNVHFVCVHIGGLNDGSHLAGKKVSAERYNDGERSWKESSQGCRLTASC